MSSYNFGTTGAEAVDGNTDGNSANGSVTHTHPDNPSWWQVDLAANSFISEVRVYNRTDCCSERLSNFKVMISKDGQTWEHVINVPDHILDNTAIDPINYCDSPYALQTHTNNYVTAVDGGGRITDVVHTDATKIGPWEQFRLVDLGNGKHAIQTYTGHYVTAVDGGGRRTDALHTDAHWTRIWEQFRLINRGNGKHAIQTYTGHYVKAHDGGGKTKDAMGTDITWIGDWEQFRLVPIPEAQNIGLSPSEAMVKAFGIPNEFRIAHKLEKGKVSMCVDRIFPDGARSAGAWIYTHGFLIKKS